MYAWRVLAILRRVACVRACHLSPHHTTRFCYAAAGCACPSMLKHRDLYNINSASNPSLHLRPQGSFLTSIFCHFFAKIADDRRQTTCGEHNATTLPHSSSGNPAAQQQRNATPFMYGTFCNSNNLDTSPSLYTYVHRGSFLTSIFSVFLRKSQMTDSRQHAESKTLQEGPCARAVSSLYGGELILS